MANKREALDTCPYSTPHRRRHQHQLDSPSHWVKTWPQTSTQPADDNHKFLKLANELKPTCQPFVTALQAVLVGFGYHLGKCPGWVVSGHRMRKGTYAIRPLTNHTVAPDLIPSPTDAATTQASSFTGQDSWRNHTLKINTLSLPGEPVSRTSSGPKACHLYDPCSYVTQTHPSFFI